MIEINAAGGTRAPLMLDWLIWLSIPKVNAEWENPESKRKGVTIYSPKGNMQCNTKERPVIFQIHLTPIWNPRLLAKVKYVFKQKKYQNPNTLTFMYFPLHFNYITVAHNVIFLNK